MEVHSGKMFSHKEKLLSTSGFFSLTYLSSVILSSYVEQSKPLAPMITMHSSILLAESTLLRNGSSEWSVSNKSFDCAIVMSLLIIAWFWNLFQFPVANPQRLPVFMFPGSRAGSSFCYLFQLFLLLNVSRLQGDGYWFLVLIVDSLNGYAWINRF